MPRNYDVPVRDFLWVVVPGGFAAGYVWLAQNLLLEIDRGRVTDAMLPVFALGLGAIGFLARFYSKVPPWRHSWIRIVGGIRRELVAITGRSRYEAEPMSRQIYRTWVEAICDANIKGYLHYNTGIFFGLASLFTFTAAFAIVPLSILCMLIVQAIHLGSIDIVLDAMALRAIGLFASAVVICFLCVRCARRQGPLILDANIALMHLPESKRQLRALADGAEESAAAAMKPEAVFETVQRAVALQRPIDAAQLSSAELQVVDQLDLRTDTVFRTVHIAAYFKTIEAARNVNGRHNLYNGPTQERITACLRETIALRLGATRVRLQCMGPALIEGNNRLLVERKPVERVSIVDALKLGIVPRGGRMLALCNELGIDHVLLRNGKLVGPCPGLRAAVESVLDRTQAGAIVFDPFAGTGLVERLCVRSNVVARCVGLDLLNGPAKNNDAFKVLPQEYFGIVVLDPLYEHLPEYLHHCLPKIQYKYCIVQTGDTCDVAWNTHMMQILDRRGVRLRDIPNGNEFGVNVVTYQRVNAD